MRGTRWIRRGWGRERTGAPAGPVPRARSLEYERSTRRSRAQGAPEARDGGVQIARGANPAVRDSDLRGPAPARPIGRGRPLRRRIPTGATSSPSVDSGAWSLESDTSLRSSCKDFGDLRLTPE